MKKNKSNTKLNCSCCHKVPQYPGNELHECSYGNCKLKICWICMAGCMCFKCKVHQNTDCVNICDICGDCVGNEYEEDGVQLCNKGITCHKLCCNECWEGLEKSYDHSLWLCDDCESQCCDLGDLGDYRDLGKILNDNKKALLRYMKKYDISKSKNMVSNIGKILEHLVEHQD